MRTSKVAKRYAQGLLNFTQEAGTSAAVFMEMRDMVNTIEKSKELQSFFNSPIIEVKKKISVSAEIFKSFSPLTRNLIQLVIKHGREKELSGIGQEFINKVEDLNGVQRITLTSATELSEDNIQSILKSTNLVNHQNKFDLKSIINPEILGGYILRVGDQQIDESVKAKLGRLNKEFQLN